ncbi:MAG: hypothetical protein M3Q27_19300, partial [Actinomycetota bacterium]|nr:hypothetical protein [Actinomycetota bacterium]
MAFMAASVRGPESPCAVMAFMEASGLLRRHRQELPSAPAVRGQRREQGRSTDPRRRLSGVRRTA